MSDEPSEHLTAAIEQLSDDINGLMQVAEEGALLKQLVDEVRVLREAIDDLRAEVEWATRNLFQNGEPRPVPQTITSMPIDPCDPAFASKLNVVSRHELPADADEPMFDDDAEIFSEDADYPEDDADEEDMSVAACEAASPPSVETPVTIRSERKANTKKQPLATRLFLHRHMADLVRLIGHDEHLAEDFRHMVQPLFEKYGAETVKSAIDELVRFEHRERQAFVRLKAEAQTLAVQIIGRPPMP